MIARSLCCAVTAGLACALAGPAAAAGSLPWASPWGTLTQVSAKTLGWPIVTYDQRGRADTRGGKHVILDVKMPCTVGSDVTLISGGLAAVAETGRDLCTTVNNADGGYTTTGTGDWAGFVFLRLDPPAWGRRPVTLPAFLDIAGKSRGQAEPTRLRVMEFSVRWTFGYHRSFMTNNKRLPSARYRVVDQRLLTP